MPFYFSNDKRMQICILSAVKSYIKLKVENEKEVSFNLGDVNNSVDNFTLLVYSYNGEAVIKISFHNYVAVEGVTLQEQLVFEVQPDGTIKAK